MIDLYCERLGPGLWAEPLNALTNLGFLVAALASWQLARRAGPADGSVLALIAMMVAIGAGSALFHTFATGWARVLDVLPILLFQLWFLWLYSRTVVGARSTYSAVLVSGFLHAGLRARPFPAVQNGSLPHVPGPVG